MKLEYENKVNLITSPLPRRNKATAEDFNEIKEVVNTNDGIVVYNNSSNTNNDITFDEDITQYTIIEVFYEGSRDAGTLTAQTIGGSQRIFNPIGKSFNVNVLNQATDNQHSKGYTATFKVSSTGITKIASSLYELNQGEAYVMNSYNAVRIKYVLAYK
jgi:hypothetical protein